MLQCQSAPVPAALAVGILSRKWFLGRFGHYINNRECVVLLSCCPSIIPHAFVEEKRALVSQIFNGRHEDSYDFNCWMLL